MVRAERKAGQDRGEGTTKTQGGTGSNQQKQVSRDTTPAPMLSDLGISRDQSSRYQKLPIGLKAPVYSVWKQQLSLVPDHFGRLSERMGLIIAAQFSSRTSREGPWRRSTVANRETPATLVAVLRDNHRTQIRSLAE